MSFIYINESPTAEIIVAKNLSSYARNLEEEILGKRAEIMRYIFGERGLPDATRTEIIEAKAKELYDLDTRLHSVNRMIREARGE